MPTDFERLCRRLDEIQQVSSGLSSSSKFEELFDEICQLTFEEEVYKSVWSERILSQLQHLFEKHTPDREVFAPQLDEIQRRSAEVSQINDFFFDVLDPDKKAEELCVSLGNIFSISTDFPNKLEESGRVTEIRNQELTASAKISLFLDFLKDDQRLDLLGSEAIQGALLTLKHSEIVGRVNALFVDRDGQGLVMPLHLKVQPGSGNAQCRVAGSETFRAAIQRAQDAMKDCGYLSNSEDVIYVLNLTDMHYEGSSIAVAAAAGIYSIKRNLAVDPYTTFTGDINLAGQNWVIQPVKNVHEKIVAAKRAGCRRVFVPIDNCDEVREVLGIKVSRVSSLEEVFVELHPSKTYQPGDSLSGKKIREIQQYCQARGWDLSLAPIQAGLQSTVVPLEHAPLKIQIYNSGTHTAKTDLQEEYGELLSILHDLDVPYVPIRAINDVLNVVDQNCQSLLKAALEKLSGSQSPTETYCIFSFKFGHEKETLTVKQFKSGKLTIQGSAGPLYKAVLETVIPIYKVHFPNSDASVEYFLSRGIEKKTHKTTDSTTLSGEIPLPHIGTDESGKGDYFGSMVIAGVFLDSSAHTELLRIGVKDSKLLSDKVIRQKANEIRNAIPGKLREVEITPERYNQLYDQFKSEKKNLNHLLAWGHARAIEDLLKSHKCSHAVADQFGDEHYIQSKLMEKGRTLQLTQVTKGERYLAVAAASILARDKFLARMETMRKTNGIAFPKGGASEKIIEVAATFIQKFGINQLGKVAKLHHKTTDKIKKA